MGFTAFGNLADCDLVYGVTGDNDGQLLRGSEEKTENPLPHGYASASDCAAVCMVFHHADFKILSHSVYLSEGLVLFCPSRCTQKNGAFVRVVI